mgnify:FL=1
MLILTRKVGERIMIDDGRVVITVVEIKDSKTARIGIDAPQEIDIHREEVFDALVRDRQRRGISENGDS